MKAIMYHYVRPDNPQLPYFRHLSHEAFVRQLDFFGENYHFVSKEEFKDALRSGVPVKNGIVLTFDDGFKDHFSYVLPELKKRNLWGFFYIPTQPYLTGKLLDVHRVHLLLGKYGGKRIFDSIEKIVSEEMLSHAHIEEFRNLTYVKQDNDEYTNLVKRTLNYYISYQFRESVLDELMAIHYPDETDIAKNFYMTKDEIYSMHGAGMVVGSHTVSHRVMSKLSPEEQKREIALSFGFLHDLVGNFDMKTFCYPYGGFHTFTEETELFLEQSGCMFSFNVEARDIEETDLVSRKQALPRYDCNMFPTNGAD
jgi:peptidoglycan/xylan/chitin deacetylase (PgdA/CDA1 family)